jgi:hypothetical protein
MVLGRGNKQDFYKVKWRSELMENFELTEDEFEMSRINFVLDAEDPRKFVKRVALAH